MDLLEAGVPERRNLWAYVGLWLVVTSWILLGLRIIAGEIGALGSFVDWLYVIVVGGGLIVGAMGVAAIRKRGEPLLALAVLAFSLVLPALYLLFFFLIGALFPDGGVD